MRLFTLLLEQTLSYFFREAIGNGQLDFLEGKTVCLRISNIGLKFFLTKRYTRLLVFNRLSSTPEVTISGKLKAFMLLATRKEDPDTLFFNRKLMIEGDTELGLQTKNWLDSLDLKDLPAVFRLFLPLTRRILY